MAMIHLMSGTGKILEQIIMSIVSWNNSRNRLYAYVMMSKC